MTFHKVSQSSSIFFCLIMLLLCRLSLFCEYSSSQSDSDWLCFSFSIWCLLFYLYLKVAKAEKIIVALLIRETDNETDCRETLCFLPSISPNKHTRTSLMGLPRLCYAYSCTYMPKCTCHKYNMKQQISQLLLCLIVDCNMLRMFSFGI